MGFVLQILPKVESLRIQSFVDFKKNFTLKGGAIIARYAIITALVFSIHVAVMLYVDILNM